MLKNCYLCGTVLADDSSADHIVPRVLLSRTQPKTKGFDYAGTLQTHALCNNEFGPEGNVTKAMSLLELLHDPNCFFEYSHPTIPNARVMAINAQKLTGFTTRDLKFFRMIDARPLSVQAMHDPAILKGQLQLNLPKQALYVSLAVLTKSAAALVVSRKLHRVPAVWDILAVPFLGDMEGDEFDDLFRGASTFDTGLKMWMAELDTGDFLCIYRAQRILIFFVFRFSDTNAASERLLSRLGNATRLRFRSKSLIDLARAEWERL